MLAAQVRHLHARFLLAQDPDDLLFRDLMQQISLLDRHRAPGDGLAEAIVDASLALPGKDVRARIRASEPEFRRIGTILKGGYGSCVDLGSIDRLMQRAAPS